MQHRWKTVVECLVSRTPTRLKRAIRSRRPILLTEQHQDLDVRAKEGSDPTLKGHFWATTESERRRDGELTVGVKADARLETFDLVDMRAFSPAKILPNGETHLLQSGRPEDVVADFSPITVHGVLDSGREVTLVDAMGTAGLSGQSFRVRYVLDGAHLEGHDQRFNAVRFQLDDARWWPHLKDGMTAVAGTMGSLSISRDGQSVWFVFELKEPMTLRECDSLVISPARTLARLALMMDLDVGPTQLRVGAVESSWIPMLTKSRGSEPVRRESEPTGMLLLPSALGIEHFATWIRVSADLDGLAAVVANPPTGVAIQAEALTMASVAEGLHRRLFIGTKRFQSLGPAQRRTVRNDAINAGVKAFEEASYPDLEEARKALSDALGHLTDVSYLSRLEELEQEAVTVTPEVTAGFPDHTWAPLVVKTRNLLAHQLDTDKRGMLEKIDAMTLAAWSLPWVLRIVLLRRAGLEPEVIREYLVEFNPFQFYQANIAALQSDRQR
ncbi:HEPN domain-containing protein [Rhodococcus sp. NPDC019627]|uniref:ApeA N-terminal domain 1-containing protein n=1 Tax=unclassified Rhodococcus (in: high G+C Gram-positive bacteria) TaxID=192944 RepID=UPI0033E5C07C